MATDRIETARGLSLRARLLRHAIRLFVRPRLARSRDPMRARRRLLRAARWLFRDPPFTLYLPDRLQAGDCNVPALWARAGAQREDGVLLYLHGGAYLMGSPRTHRALAARLGRAAGLAALLPHYRRAPEHPFPAAFDDCVATYLALLERGYPARRIALAGDSAGGGLALALLAEIDRSDLPRPAAVVAFSPLTDLTFSGNSVRTNARCDAMLPSSRTADMAAYYKPHGDRADPRASPLFARWTRPPPPVLLQVAQTEILLDDSLRMAAALREAGGQVRCDVRGDLPHVWPIFHGLIPEAAASISEAARFLRRTLAAERATGGQA